MLFVCVFVGAHVCECVRVQCVVSQGRSWLQARTHYHSTLPTHITGNTFTPHIEIDIVLRPKLIISAQTERVASQGRNWLQAHVGGNEATDWLQKAKQFIADHIEIIVE